MRTIQIPEVKALAEQRLVGAGLERSLAAALVDHMITADLWGRRSHGLSVRFPYVLSQAQKGAGRAQAEIAMDHGSAVLVDARDGFGYAAGDFCTSLLVGRVESHGLAAVSLINSRHTGMLGYYAERAARSNVVTLLFSHCCPLMAPYGGTRALLGTNPLAFGFPFKPDPIIVDMATSALNYGDVLLSQSAGRQLPEGCAVDADGRPTLDPAEARKGALLPFGGHRGGALALAVQVLSGILTGASPIPPHGHEYGLLFIGMSKGLFAGEAGYDEALAQFAAAYLSTPPIKGSVVRLPGSKRFENCRNGRKSGLDVSDELAKLLGL